MYIKEKAQFGVLAFVEYNKQNNFLKKKGEKQNGFREHSKNFQVFTERNRA